MVDLVAVVERVGFAAVSVRIPACRVVVAPFLAENLVVDESRGPPGAVGIEPSVASATGTDVPDRAVWPSREKLGEEDLGQEDPEDDRPLPEVRVEVAEVTVVPRGLHHIAVVILLVVTLL